MSLELEFIGAVLGAGSVGASTMSRPAGAGLDPELGLEFGISVLKPGSMGAILEARSTGADPVL